MLNSALRTLSILIKHKKIEIEYKVNIDKDNFNTFNILNVKFPLY
jgi:hypothetical protein